MRNVWQLVIRVTIVGVIALVLAGCSAKATIRVEPQLDGTGLVSVAIDLDQEMVEAIGDPKTDLRFDDLERKGWTVSIGDVRDDGGVQVLLARECRDPNEIADALRDTGIVDLVTIESSLERFKHTLNVDFVVDLTQGAQSFGDTQLAALVDSTSPLGVDTQTLTDRYGASLDSYFDVSVEVVEPDESLSSTSSNHDTSDGSVLAWDAASGETTIVHAKVTKWRQKEVAVGVGGAVCLLALVLLAGGVTRRRYRSRHVESV